MRYGQIVGRVINIKSKGHLLTKLLVSLLIGHLYSLLKTLDSIGLAQYRMRDFDVVLSLVVPLLQNNQCCGIVEKRVTRTLYLYHHYYNVSISINLKFVFVFRVEHSESLLLKVCFDKKFGYFDVVVTASNYGTRKVAIYFVNGRPSLVALSEVGSISNYLMSLLYFSEVGGS